MAWTQNLLALCFFGCAPDAAFLGFAWWLKFSQWLGHDFIVFRGSKRNVFRMRSRRSFLGLCQVAVVSQWLGHDSLFLGVPKQRFEIFEVAVPQWLGRKTCWGSAFSDALPTQLS